MNSYMSDVRRGGLLVALLTLSTVAAILIGPNMDGFDRHFRPCRYWTRQLQFHQRSVAEHEQRVMECDSMQVLLARIGGIDSVRSSDVYRFLSYSPFSILPLLDDDDLALDSILCQDFRDRLEKGIMAIRECESTLTAISCEK